MIRIFKSIVAALIVALCALNALILWRGWPMQLTGQVQTLAAPDAATQPLDYSQLLHECKSDLDAGHYPQALSSALKAVQQDERRYEGYALCSAALVRLGHLDDAESAAKLALARAPEDKKPALNRMLDEIHAAGGGEASSAAQRSAYDLLLSKARAHIKDGKLAEALAAAQVSIELEPKRFEGHALIAFILNAQGSKSEAKREIGTALSLAPSEKRDKLREIASIMSTSTPTAPAPATPAVAAHPATQPAAGAQPFPWDR